MLCNKTACFFRVKNKKEAEEKENMHILYEFMDTELRNKKSAFFRQCLLCKSFRRYKGAPVCLICIKKHFLRTESFPIYSISNLYSELCNGGWDESFLKEVEGKAKALACNGRDCVRCIWVMYMNILKLLRILTQRRIEEKKQQERANAVLSHYLAIKKAYKKVLLSTDWGSLFILKEALLQILSAKDILSS